MHYYTGDDDRLMAAQAGARNIQGMIEKTRAQLLQDLERCAAYLNPLEFEGQPKSLELLTRSCEVDGKPAVFHRWVDEDKALLQVNIIAKQDVRKAIVQEFKEDGVVHSTANLKTVRKAIVQEFKEDGVVHSTANLKTVRQTFAIVEYADGTVCKVEPEKVKFTDRRTTEC